jgi:hypothetical protein
MNHSARLETYAHIHQVWKLLARCYRNLVARARCHDQSKLEPPESEIFEAATDRLAALTYGSPEYFAALEEMKPPDLPGLLACESIPKVTLIERNLVGSLEVEKIGLFDCPHCGETHYGADLRLGPRIVFCRQNDADLCARAIMPIRAVDVIGILGKGQT